MSTKKMIYDANGDVVRVLHYDPRAAWDADFTIQTVQDCTALVEGNKVLRENHKRGPKENFRLVARAPVSVVERAFREGWYHDDRAWARWLNDADNRDFRVVEGRV
jgi:hypothetical protein